MISGRESGRVGAGDGSDEVATAGFVTSFEVPFVVDEAVEVDEDVVAVVVVCDRFICV